MQLEPWIKCPFCGHEEWLCVVWDDDIHNMEVRVRAHCSECDAAGPPVSLPNELISGEECTAAEIWACDRWLNAFYIKGAAWTQTFSQ